MAANGSTFTIITDSSVQSTLDGSAVAGSTSFSLSVSGTVIDTNSKDDTTFKSKISGKREWSISSDWLWGTSTAFDYLNDCALDGSTVLISITNGTQSWDGSAVIQSFDVTYPDDDVVTASISLVGIGALTYTAS